MTLICPINRNHTKVFRQSGSGQIACLECHQAFEAAPVVKKRGNKFGAVKTMSKLGMADSLKEGRRLDVLHDMATRGEIKELVAHPKYPIKAWSPSGPVDIGHYSPDAQYRQGDVLIAEDVKSEITRRQGDYQLRRKIFQANYPHIDFRET